MMVENYSNAGSNRGWQQCIHWPNHEVYCYFTLHYWFSWLEPAKPFTRTFQTLNHTKKRESLQNLNNIWKYTQFHKNIILNNLWTRICYLFNRPLSFKKLKVTFNHLKFNVTFFPRWKNLKIFLITIQNSLSIKFDPKCQVLLPNLSNSMKDHEQMQVKGQKVKLTANLT